MALHLLKLAVGADSLESVKAWAAAAAARNGMAITTRMAPKRADEILKGGSLYWVIRGSLQARQRILRFEPFKDEAGVGRVRIHLGRDVVPVRPRPCRPFQGWRYLKGHEAPPDISEAALSADIPAAMRRELSELCLL